MTYTISPETTNNGQYFQTLVFIDYEPQAFICGDTKEESRLRAIKHAMLMAIEESEAIMNDGDLLNDYEN